jgi:hypothetical protein
VKRLILLVFILAASSCFGAGIQSDYSPANALRDLSNVKATAEPSMTSITLSDKVKAAWAEITGNIYASGTAVVDGRLLIGIPLASDDTVNKLQVAGSTRVSQNNCSYIVKSFDLAIGASVDVKTLLGLTGDVVGTLRIFSKAGAAGDFLLSGAGNVSTLATNFASAASTDTASTISVFSAGAGAYTIKNNFADAYSHMVVWQGFQ